MKKFVGYILLGVAVVQIFTSLITVFIYPQIYERRGLPESFIRIFITSTLVISIVVTIVLVCAGVIILIKGTK